VKMVYNKADRASIVFAVFRLRQLMDVKHWTSKALGLRRKVDYISTMKQWDQGVRQLTVSWQLKIRAH
jgi:hypothetical protein